jgi:dienelactone hydrolase
MKALLCLLVTALFWGCSAPPASVELGVVVSDGHRAQNAHACQVFWHPMRTRLPQRGAIAEFATAELGKPRSLQGQWEQRSAQVTWTLTKSENGTDHYHFDIVTRQAEGGQRISKDIVMTGEPVVVFESRYHRVTIAPLKTPPVELLNFGYFPALVQRPEVIADDAAILIYYHGAGHDERQGARLFPYMRELLAEKGWILVSARAYEFTQLRESLFATYGKRRVFLAGASAGGAFSYRASMEEPDAVDGLLLVGAAVTTRTDAPNPAFKKPCYLIFGDQDAAFTTGARRIGTLLEAQVPTLSKEIPGGGHDVAHFDLSWWADALTFVCGEPFGPQAD